MQDNRLRASIGYALARAFRVMNREMSRALLPHGLTAEQAHILLALWFEGPQKIGALQRMLALGSGTLSGAVDRMAEAGLVRRLRDPADKRASVVESAAVDARSRRAVIATCEGAEEGVLAQLTAAERKELFRLLEKLVPAE